MAKDKTKAGVPNKHLHARISYLQRAATYLASQTSIESQQAVTERGTIHFEQLESLSTQRTATASPTETEKAVTQPASASDAISFQQPVFGGLPLQLSSHLTQVARKSQIRLHSAIKHAICKRCSMPLIEGHTSKKTVENLSKGGRKPLADILVLECKACGATKRWPVGAKRQDRKTKRKQGIQERDGASKDAKDAVAKD